MIFFLTDILNRVKASKRGARLLLKYILNGSNNDKIQKQKKSSSLRDSFPKNINNANTNGNKVNVNQPTNKFPPNTKQHQQPQNPNNNNNKYKGNNVTNPRVSKKRPLKLKPIRISRRFIPLVLILRKLIRNFKKCKLKSLLKRYCPVSGTTMGEEKKQGTENKNQKTTEKENEQQPEKEKEEEKKETEKEIEQMETNSHHSTSSSSDDDEDDDLSPNFDQKLTPLVRGHSPVQQVVGFLRAFLKRVIPKRLFGSDTNFQMFLKSKTKKSHRILLFETINHN